MAHAPPVRLDPATGLRWEDPPTSLPVSWDVAMATATRGWRLPTAAELMDFLSRRTLDAPVAGSAFWSSSESPFAPATRARAIVAEGAGRYAMVVFDKRDPAGRWLIHDGTG